MPDGPKLLDHHLGTNDANWKDVFKHDEGIRGLDRGNAKPLADLSSDGQFIEYNIPFFVGNLEIANYNGKDATDFFRGAYGSSLVTIWIGSNPEMPHMAGHMPDIMTFNAKGDPLGEYHGNSHRASAGSVYQLIVRNHNYAPLENPTHVRVWAGGHDAVCISAIMVSGYGGYAALWTADTMVGCNNLDELHERARNGAPRNFDLSTTTIQGHQPRCIWLDRDNYSKQRHRREDRPHGIEFHIPSMIATPEKQRAWLNNPDLLCNQSPRQRFSTYEKERYDNHAFYDALTVFNPELQFEKETLLDKIPERILQWRPTNDQIGPSVFTDVREHWHESVWDDKRSLDNYNKTDIEPPRTPTPQKMIQPSERKLVISRSAISAKGRCLIANGNQGDIGDGSDYLSLQEKIYCDIVTKGQYAQCDDTNKVNCFDTDMMMLRSGLSVEEDLLMGNVTAGHMFRAATEVGASPYIAALYGIPYTNIVSIA